MAKKQKTTEQVEQVEVIEEVKVKEVKSEPKTADEIYEFIVELHKEAEAAQNRFAQTGCIPTSLQTVTYQLLICKNNIATALGK